MLRQIQEQAPCKILALVPSKPKAAIKPEACFCGSRFRRNKKHPSHSTYTSLGRLVSYDVHFAFDVTALS